MISLSRHTLSNLPPMAGTCSVENCYMPLERYGLCRAHAIRKQRSGHELAGQTVQGMAAAFIEHVVTGPRTTECIEWPFYTHVLGYAMAKIEGKYFKVSRIVLSRLTSEPLDTDLHALHDPILCNNRACVNPDHLRWGTNDENVADREIAGNTLRGADVGTAVLTEDVVAAIWLASGTRPEIAKRFGVPFSLVRNIKTRRSWRCVTDDLTSGEVS